MQIGLINYKNQLDQQKNKTQPTDKRQIQRQIKIEELETLQSKQVDLQDIDKSLFKINPHHYPKTEFVNKRIIQLKVQTAQIPEEEIDKFTNYLEEKSNQQYVLGAQKLSEGLQSAQSRFLLGKQRIEQTEYPKEETKYIKNYQFGVLKSALKKQKQLAEELNNEQLDQQQQQIKEQQENEKQAKEASELQDQVSEQQNIIRLHKILGISKGKKEQPESNNEQTKSTNEIQTDQESSKLHFLNVFKQDNMINTKLLEEVYPTVKFEEIQRPKNTLPEDRDLLRRLSMLNSQSKQPSKITFNDEVKVATFMNDEYFAEDGTIFRNIDELTNSIRYAQSKDNVRIIDKPKIVQLDEITNWSQNTIHYYKKEEIQQEDPVIFQDVILQDDYQRQRYNNIYLNTTQKKDYTYFRGGDPSESIQESLKNLQNMKCHQYVSDKNLDIQLKKQGLSQIESVQKENENLVHEFAEQDLEQKDILSQFHNKQSSIQKIADNKGLDINQGVEKLSRQFNSNQWESKLPPNFNGVTQLNAGLVQFTQIPQKQEHYTKEEEEKFKDFYSNFQAPLDILHKNTGTYQQAIEIEQDYLQRQLELKSSFQLGKLPRPQFYANQYQLPENQKNGNQHQILVMPDKELMKRYKYRMVPMDVVTARQVYQKY